jgi:hypothetical protein
MNSAAFAPTAFFAVAMVMKKRYQKENFPASNFV